MSFPETRIHPRAFAHHLRLNATPAEKAMWDVLRQRRCGGFRFYRQRVIAGDAIVDFYCPAAKLAVEVDGSSHRGREQWDTHRQNVIESYGVQVLRYTNEEALAIPGKVARLIEDAAKRRVRAG